MDVSAGQFLFILVKLSGLTAMALLVLQIVFGLTRRVLPFLFSIGQHQALGAATLLVIAFHITTFVVAASMRNKIPALDLLWPNFHGYYRTWLTAGLIGSWLLILGLIGALLGGRWRRLHWLMPVGFTLAFVHSLRVGSEARTGTMLYVYAGYALAALMGLALRIRLAPSQNHSPFSNK